MGSLKKKLRIRLYLLIVLISGVIAFVFFQFTQAEEPLFLNGVLRSHGQPERKPMLSSYEIELEIPQMDIAKILSRYRPDDVNGELDVEFLLASAPTMTFKGKLAQDKIAKLASPGRFEEGPVFQALVRVSPLPGPDGQPDIAPEAQIPKELLLTETAAHCRIQ
jgi:hypothetical protein